MKKNFEKYGKHIWRLLFAAVIVLISFIRVKQIAIPISSSTEIPYWDLILRMAGREGIVDVSETSYLVSFGYCLPFSILIRNGVSLLTVYKLAVFANGLLWAALYLITAWIGEKMTSSDFCFVKREGMMSILCILPVFVSQAFVMGPQILLGIMALVTGYWISRRKNQKSITRKEGILCCLLAWIGMFLSPLYIGVILGIAAYLVIARKGDKEGQKNWYMLLFVLIAGILLMEIVEHVMLIQMQVSRNEWNYSGLHSLFIMVAKGRRSKGLLGLIYGMIGKSMYLITNTVGLVLVGLYGCYKNRENGTSFSRISGLMFSHVILFVAAIQRVDVDCGLPVDSILAMVLIPVLLEAASIFMKQEVNIKNVVTMVAVILIVGCLSRDVWELKDNTVVDWAMTGILALGRNFCRDVFENSILAASSVAIIFLLLWITNSYGKIVKDFTKEKFMRIYTGFFQIVMNVIVVILAAAGVKYYASDILPYAQDKIQFAYDVPGDYLETTNRPLRYYYTGSAGNGIAFTRLLSMENQNIKYIESLNTVEKLNKKSILITKDMTDVPEEIIANYERVYSTNQIVVWEHKNLEIKDTLKSSLTGEKVKFAKVNSSDFTFEEYGKNYIQPKGIYEVEVNLRITTSKKGKLGRVAVRTGADTLVSKNIEGSGKQEKQTIKVTFENAEDMTNFRIAVHKNRSVDIEVDSVYMKKVGDAYEKEE